MTDPVPTPRDEAASDALEASLHGASPEDLDEPTRIRMEQMASIRDLMADDDGSLPDSRIDEMVGEALAAARGGTPESAPVARPQTAPVPAARHAGARGRQRLAWIAGAAAALILVVALSVLAIDGVGNGNDVTESASVDAPSDPDTELDTDAESGGAVVAPEGPAPTTTGSAGRSEAAPQTGGPLEEGDDPGSVVLSPADAVAGIRFTVFVPIR